MSSCFFIDGSAVPEKGIGPTCRNAGSKDGLIRNFYPNIYTIYGLFKNGVEKYPKAKCIGKREIVNGKLTENFIYISYEETFKQSEYLANGLLKKNLIKETPFSEHKTPAKTNYKLVGLFSKNRMEWFITEFGVFALNSTIVPFYDTFGPEAIKAILIETGINTVFCSDVEIKLLLNIVNENNKSVLLKNIILYDPLPDELKSLVNNNNINILYYKDLIELGKQSSFTPTPPDELDPAFIFYTSGTTGAPKGVIMLHQNLSTLSQNSMLHHKSIIFPPGNFYLSYLPYAHVFEHFVQGIIISSGGAIGFFSGDKNKVLEDIKVLKPTIFASVPRIYNRMKDKIFDNVHKSGGIKAWLFYKGLSTKLENLTHNKCTHWFYDSMIFSKIKKMIGFDRIALGLSGSAPLTVDTLSFLKILFCCPVLQGFGMTESAGGVTCTTPGDMTTSNDCGIIVHGCEMRLLSVPEMSYLITDKYHNRIVDNGQVIEEGIECYGRGELVYRGYNRTPGYFRRSDLTSSVIDQDGWLHTGDVALITKEYKLVIIDRIKNILKLSQGEYVAVENLENYYQTCQYIDQIFVYGDSFQSCLVAVIVPDESSTKHWASLNAISDFNFSVVCTSNEFKKFIMSELENVAKERKLNGIERIRNIFLDSKPFSVEEGTLTPTMKLKRTDLKKKYIDTINELYKTIVIPNR